MALLRRGITGFDATNDVEFRDFKKAVNDLAQLKNATILNVIEANGVTPNFHQAELQYAERELSIICNRHYPVMAFVKLPINMSGVESIDLTELADILLLWNFEVPSAAELEKRISPEDLNLLSDSEREQAKYWKSKRVADLVFNWWD